MPRIVDHDLRRAQLLDAAFHAFDAHGYGALSMRDLARTMGTSTGTLYHYFDGKEDLFETLVRRRFEADLASATATLPDDGPPEARLAALGGWVAEHTEHLQSTLRLVLDYVRQDGDADFVREVLDGYRAPLRDALGPALAGPGLSLVLGLLVHRLLDEEAVDLRSHLALLARLAGG